MIRVSILGGFDGYQESKSYPKQHYCYIRPLTVPMNGFLKTVKCPKKFGQPEDAVQKIGNFAVLCPIDKIPTVAIGDKINLSAICWPVTRPVWSTREKAIIHSRELNPVFTLDGDIKSTSVKSTPPAFTSELYFSGAVRQSSSDIFLECIQDEAPPEGILRTVRIRKGKDYVSGTESLGMVKIHTSAGNLPATAPNTPLKIKGQCWPVLTPYFSEKISSVEYSKVPDVVFVASEISQVKAAS